MNICFHCCNSQQQTHACLTVCARRAMWSGDHQYAKIRLYDVFPEADHVLDANALARAENVGDCAHNSLQPARNFVRRPELLEQIERQLGTDKNDPRQQHRNRVLTVWGLPGREITAGTRLRRGPSS
jgi:hypothetical protein